MPIDYDAVASTYDRRYELHDYPGIRSALADLVATLNTCRALELGCGTCKWLALLAESGCKVAGIDPHTDAAKATRTATLVIATIRGLLLDLLATGERSRVEEAAQSFLASLEKERPPARRVRQKKG